ncbi:hypothetical protein H6504_02030 [Candidatus Woesearchaeota archaeon]|nr:hypothetical protein [Candidatus Woesearchaeota archaeon]
MRCLILLFLVFLMVPSVIGFELIIESISPMPAIPGENLTLQIRVLNDDTVTKDLTIIPRISDPFFITGKSNAGSETKLLCAKCSSATTYYMQVRDDVHTGIYPLSFRLKTGATTYTDEQVDIRVRGTPNIIITTESSTNISSPGDHIEIALSVVNSGSSKAKYIKLTPKHPGFIVEGSELLYFDVLPEKTSKNTTLRLLASKDISPGTYRVPLEVVYTDEAGDMFKEEYSLGIPLAHKADVNLQQVKIDEIYRGERASLDVVIENIGQGDAKETKVILRNAGTEDIYSFVGLLKASDDVPAVLFYQPEQQGKKTATIIIEYKDDYGTHERSEEITFEVKSKPLLSLPVLIFLAIIIFLAVFLGAYRAHRP